MNGFRKYLWLAAGVLALTPASYAEDLKIETKLIWATNGEKSSDPKHKLIEGQLAEKLRKIFTWTNYFEISRQTGVVPNRGTKAFKVSEECVVEITELEGPKVEVKLIGKGKSVNKTVKALSRGEFFTLGGDGKNGTAWFVIISQLDEKAADPKAQLTNNSSGKSVEPAKAAEAANGGKKVEASSSAKVIVTNNASPK
ncbi:MAG: hypothetical protein L0Y58_10155 [Verrucomicrobia subdivision 3 bacterium]|nr:hypothetical protein [Limisphaerales bacterium]